MSSEGDWPTELSSRCHGRSAMKIGCRSKRPRLIWKAVLYLVHRSDSAGRVLFRFAFADNSIIAQEHRHLRTGLRAVFRIINPSRVSAKNDAFRRRGIFGIVTDGLSIRL